MGDLPQTRNFSFRAWAIDDRHAAPLSSINIVGGTREEASFREVLAVDQETPAPVLGLLHAVRVEGVHPRQGRSTEEQMPVHVVQRNRALQPDVSARPRGEAEGCHLVSQEDDGK